MYTGQKGRMKDVATTCIITNGDMMLQNNHLIQAYEKPKKSGNLHPVFFV